MIYCSSIPNSKLRTARIFDNSAVDVSSRLHATGKATGNESQNVTGKCTGPCQLPMREAQENQYIQKNPQPLENKS